MREGYILGLDGGQSGTACVVGTADGRLLAAGFGGPCNHVGQPGGPERMRRALDSSISGALATASPPPERLAAAYLSLTGGQDLARTMVPAIVAADRIEIDSDAMAALASGTHGGPGIALIAGTGAVAVALGADGKRVIRGGWGYLVGDEGSGYWIGMQCIQSAARAEDGRGPRTPLYAEVLRHCGVTSVREIAQRIYEGEGSVPPFEGFGRPEIAAMAPLALAGADAGDPVAAGILERAAVELTGLVEATCEAAGFTEEAERIIVPVGGVLRPGTALWRRFVPRLTERLPGWRIVPPSVPPVVGAYLLGLRLAEVTVDEEVLDRVRETMEGIPGLEAKRLPATTRP